MVEVSVNINCSSLFRLKGKVWIFAANFYLDIGRQKSSRRLLFSCLSKLLYNIIALIRIPYDKRFYFETSVVRNIGIMRHKKITTK